MTESIEEIVLHQFQKVNAGLLRCFEKESVLGYEYSLLDCDYFDDNRWYPDDGDDWIGIVPGLTLEKVLSRWSPEEKAQLREQLQQKKNIYKCSRWSDVSSDYLKKHQSGFFHMGPHAFKHYLAAWIHLYVNSKDVQQIEDIQGMTARFLRKLADGFICSNDPWWISLTPEQKDFILDFLMYLVMLGGDEQHKARQALENGWLEINSEGQRTLNKYYDAKFVDDFINSTPKSD